MKQEPRHRANVADLPAPGTVFLVPLADGRFGACRVLRNNADDPELLKKMGAPAVLVATTAWIGTSPPEPANTQLGTILILTHHKWGGKADLTWTPYPPPSDYREIGMIDSSLEEQSMDYNSFGGWSASVQVLTQWRWDHDREALMGEEAIERIRAREKMDERARERKKKLSGMTYEKLRASVPFADWKAPKALVARQIFFETIDEVEALGEKPKRRGVMRVIKNAIERFNELDGEPGQTIDTMDREEIYERFTELLAASGSGVDPEVIDGWRTW